MKHGMRGARPKNVGHGADVEAGQAWVAGRIIEHGYTSLLHDTVWGQLNAISAQYQPRLCKREGASKVLQVSESLLPCLCQSGGLDQQSHAPHQNPFVGLHHALHPGLDHGTAPEGYQGIYIIFHI